MRDCTIRAVETGRQVTAILLADGTEPTGGTARIRDVEMPRAESIPVFEGYVPRRQTLPMLIDEWRSRDRDARDKEDRLIAMAEPREHVHGPERVTWDTGGVLPFDLTRYPKGRWWIEDLVWGRRLVRRGKPARIRVDVKLVRLPDTANRLKVTRRPPRGSLRVIQTGETVSSIAHAIYGDRSAARRILDASGIRDPRSATVGTELIVPED